MKYTFVGDIHGKIELVERALSQDGQIVFVGDFMDSFDRTNSDHFKCLRVVCDAIRAGKAQSIYGNHELSYIMPQVHRCSGFSPTRNNLMQAYEPELKELFKPFILIEDLLVTHAGLSRYIWDKYELSRKTLAQTLAEWFAIPTSPMHWIGRRRGGMAVVGGPFWCHFPQDFSEIPDLPQIFGHTRDKTIRQQGNSFCIDCLDYTDTFLSLEL